MTGPIEQPLKGRVALVTGASRGIGRAVALALGRAGASIAALSTKQEGTRTLVERLAEEGQRAFSVGCDVRSAQAVSAAVAQVESSLGPVDILVNNAGIVRRLPLEAMTDEDFDAVLGVNLAAPFYFIRRLVPKMAQRGYGRVINISSISSTLGTPTMTAYCASKWGLNGLTRAVAEEVRGRGVLVASVLPGGVDTDMLQGSGFPAQMGPDEVASVVAFLCTGAPLAMTGSLVELFG